MTSGKAASGLKTALLVTAVALWATSVVADKLSVVTSTTLLRSAVTEIGGKHVSVNVLIAPGSCPGHYDVSPQSIRKLTSCGLVLTHGYEEFIDKLVDGAGKNKPRLVKVRIKGNWMIPDVYVRGAKQVADALCAADPKNSSDYRSAASRLESRVKKLSAGTSKDTKVRKTSRVAVLCADQQKPFVEWMGFAVAGTYARPEEFTPSRLHALTSIGRKRNVRLVIDNLQSGPNAGRQLARDIGAKHVTVSNFPGGYAGTQTWDACFKDNVRRILESLK